MRNYNGGKSGVMGENTASSTCPALIQEKHGALTKCNKSQHCQLRVRGKVADDKAGDMG